MLIAHLRFTVSPEDRLKALDALMQGARVVRAMKGCVAFYPFYDPEDDSVLGVVHEWESEADFSAYGSSDAFKAFGAVLRPMMIGAPVSRRFRADLIEVIH